MTKTVVQNFIIFILLLPQIVVCVNLDRLLGAYESVCGGFFCDSNKRMISGIFKNEENCPPCSCDNACLKTQNCCPDLFFVWNMTYFDTAILGFTTKMISNRKINMVQNCPENAKEEMKNKCEHVGETFEEQLKNVPVFSLLLWKTYRNIDCLKCNNISVETNNTSSLGIEISCESFVDFNFVSSYEEFEEKAEESKCDIYYSFQADLEYSQDETLIDRCNVTGTWLTFDPDIEYACRVYENTYITFKSIFCYVCNPPRKGPDLISSCNITGLWNEYDQSLETGCLLGVETTATLPFKNFYCYRCNTRTGTDSDGSIIRFQELEAISPNVTFMQMKNNVSFHFVLQSLSLNYDEIFNNGIDFLLGTGLSDFLAELNNQTNQKIQRRSELNVTNILAYYLAFTGQAHFYKNYSFVAGLDSCDSSESCIFDKSDCCIDKLLELSTSCTDSSSSLEGQTSVVFDSCPDHVPPVLHNLCSLTPSSYIYSFVPTEIQIDDDHVLQYKNVFCAMCNDPTPYRYGPKLWDVDILCEEYIPSSYFTSFSEYIETLSEHDCTVKYIQPEKGNIKCSFDQHCNDTGFQHTYHKDLEFACDNIYMQPRCTGFYNDLNFCKLCNPEWEYDIIHSTCNETGFWQDYDSETENYCLQLPAIEGDLFKNHFCQKCNGFWFLQTDCKFLDNDEQDLPDYSWEDSVGGFDVNDISYRSIFAFSNYKQPNPSHMSEKCNDRQVSFGNECRDIVCYPGRILVDLQCLPLLPVSFNLGYILAFRTKSEITTDVNNTEDFHMQITDNFTELLHEQLKDTREIKLESKLILSNQYCSKNSKLVSGTKVMIDIYFKFFIQEGVNRSSVEERLIELLTISFNVTFENSTFVFTNELHAESFDIPSTIPKLKFTERCYLQDVVSDLEAKKFVHSHVSELLSCKQIELKREDYEIDENDGKMRVIVDDIQLTSENYMLISGQKGRICIDRFEALKLEKLSQNPKKNLNVWNIVTMGCLCVSLACLLITFITYCLFRQLRSLPGKNNMCLVFTMFFANFSFLFIAFGMESQNGCKLLGIILHYFWISTFACLNVCSFHMFRVFTSKTRFQKSEKTILIQYLIFSFGVPALIVALNIIINISVTKHSIGYGYPTCFINHQIAFLVTFICPIGLVILLNIFYFLFTSITIARTPTVEQGSDMKTNKVHFIVYFKLFVITGISWGFQLIDAFVPESAFSTIVAILNALQGLFIFMSYVCNKRVLELYKNQHKSLKTKYASRNSSRMRSYTSELTSTSAI